MRLSLIIAILSLANISSSQTLEASFSAYGFGNYTPEMTSNDVRFQDLSYSPMASIMYHKNWSTLETNALTFKSGIGLSFTQYSGSWEEQIRDGIVGGSIFESDEVHRYNATINALGLEITPVIATFFDLFEIRTGLFLGVPIGNQYTQKYGLSYATSAQGVTLYVDGAMEDVPVTFKPNAVLHWNSRVAFNVNLRLFSISPFYQYSKGFLKEGTSFTLSNITTYRHHFGLTFGYAFNQKK